MCHLVSRNLLNKRLTGNFRLEVVHCGTTETFVTLLVFSTLPAVLLNQNRTVLSICSRSSINLVILCEPQKTFWEKINKPTSLLSNKFHSKYFHCCEQSCKLKPKHFTERLLDKR